MRRDNRTDTGAAVNANVSAPPRRRTLERFATAAGKKKGPGGFLQPGQGRRKMVRRRAMAAAAEFRG